MKAGDRVKTEYGRGTVVKQEGTEGILAQRYCVKLDNCPLDFIYMQDEQGGLYFFKDELKKK